jgi:NADH-quinone oxidoreductase subunit L
MMLIGNLALTGFGIPILGIGTAGFYSKDGIINATFQSGTGIGMYAFVLTLTAAAFTSFYSWRQFLMTFHGRYRGADADEHESYSSSHAEEALPSHHKHEPLPLAEVHESPLSILAPLAVLAVGALFAGAIFQHWFVGHDASGFWRGAVAMVAGRHPGEEVPMWVEFGPFVALILGFAVAYYYYILHPELPAKLAARRGLLYLFLYNKWYFDEIYDFLFVRPSLWLARVLWKVGDGLIIDGLGPDGVAARVLDATRGAVRLQTGYIYNYAFAMLIGVVLLATWFVLGGGFR